jgi:hypothetical protein
VRSYVLRSTRRYYRPRAAEAPATLKSINLLRVRVILPFWVCSMQLATIS